MKKGKDERPKPRTPAPTAPPKTYVFPNVSNENCIRIALKLLGVSE
jgi:hypothetical protein